MIKNNEIDTGPKSLFKIFLEPSKRKREHRFQKSIKGDEMFVLIFLIH